jgi:hypothetical protein
LEELAVAIGMPAAGWLPTSFPFEVDAFAAGAIGHDFVDLSTKLANPNSQNGKGKSVFAIAKMCAFFGLFCHLLPSQVWSN